MVFFEEVVDGFHLLAGAAGEVRDEKRDQVLLLAALLADLLEKLHEFVELLRRTFAHQFEHFWIQVFGSDLQVSRHVLGNQLAQQFRLAQREVEADPGVDVDVFDLRVGAHPAQQPHDLQPGAGVV